MKQNLQSVITGLITLLGLPLMADLALPDHQEKLNPGVHTLGIDMFMVRWSFASPTMVYKETGYFQGLRLSNDYRSPNQAYFFVDSLVAFGNDRYKVHGRGIYAGYEDHYESRQTWYDVNLRVGHTYQPSISKGFLISPFIGPGFHQERMDGRRLQWYFGQIEVYATQEFSEKLKLGLDFKVMRTFAVRDHYRIGNIATNFRSQFWGLEMGMPIAWSLGEAKKLTLRCKPYFVKQNLDSMEYILGSVLEVGYKF